jgi:hypothetical protein
MTSGLGLPTGADCQLVPTTLHPWPPAKALTMSAAQPPRGPGRRKTQCRQDAERGACTPSRSRARGRAAPLYKAPRSPTPSVLSMRSSARPLPSSRPLHVRTEEPDLAVHAPVLPLVSPHSFNEDGFSSGSKNSKPSRSPSRTRSPCTPRSRRFPSISAAGSSQVGFHAAGSSQAPGRWPLPSISLLPALVRAVGLHARAAGWAPSPWGRRSRGSE